MIDTENRDLPSVVIDAVEDPIRPPARAGNAGELAAQLLDRRAGDHRGPRRRLGRQRRRRGRAGTVVVCILMVMGIERDEALRTVVAHRPMTGPEAGAQRSSRRLRVPVPQQR